MNIKLPKQSIQNVYTERLLTEREVCMEKYQTEVLTVRTERTEV